MRAEDVEPAPRADVFPTLPDDDSEHAGFSPAVEAEALYEEAEPYIEGRFDLHEKLRRLVSKKYRERKAIEDAFERPTPPKDWRNSRDRRSSTLADASADDMWLPGEAPTRPRGDGKPDARFSQESAELLNAVKKLKPRQKSDLSKRGVVRVIYHATMDKESCPLCAYLDGMVMDPDDPASDIFSPPLFQGCTCRREYVLKTEKPSNWPDVTFEFPPEELLIYLEKQ